MIALGFVRPKIEDLFKWSRIVESACLLKRVFFFFWITCLLKEPKGPVWYMCLKTENCCLKIFLEIRVGEKVR